MGALTPALGTGLRVNLEALVSPGNMEIVCPIQDLYKCSVQISGSSCRCHAVNEKDKTVDGYKQALSNVTLIRCMVTTCSIVIQFLSLTWRDRRGSCDLLSVYCSPGSQRLCPPSLLPELFAFCCRPDVGAPPGLSPGRFLCF